jgi:hypothetical protein
MSAQYRLQALQGEAMSQLMGLVESTKITLDNSEEGSPGGTDGQPHTSQGAGGEGSPGGTYGQPHTRARGSGGS